MAEPNFDACIEIVLAHEGGLSMIRSDPGNWTGGRVGAGALRGTNYGIAASAHPTLDIASLTKDGAKLIYRADYWAKIGGDALPAGVDLAVLDPAVNSGPAMALKWLRAARSTATTDDGVITAICSARLSFLRALRTWRAFGKGWGARVADIEAKAHRMALGPSPAASSAIAAKGAHHRVKALAAKTRAKASVASGPIAAGGTAVAHGHSALVIVVLLAALAAAGVLAFVAWRDGQRADALAAEAKTPGVKIRPPILATKPIPSQPTK